MSSTLLIVLHWTISVGAVAGLGVWLYCGVNGDWLNALIAFGVYSFSLVMLS